MMRYEQDSVAAWGDVSRSVHLSAVYPDMYTSSGEVPVESRTRTEGDIWFDDPCR